MKKMELSEFAYKCILFLLIIDAAIYNTTVNEVFKDSLHSCCLVVTIAFSILCILVRRYSIKELLAHVSILLLAVMSYIISGNTDMFASILLVVLAWKLNIDDILKMIFSIRFVVFISVVLLSLVGVLKKGSIALTSADKGVLFGYGHANTFAGSAGILIFLMFAICRNNLKKIHFVIAVIADLLIFYFSRARTSLLLMTALVFILLMCKYVKNMDKVILKVAKYFQSILLIIIFGLIFLRAKEMMPRFVDMVDKLMNGRILLSAMNLAYYPVTLIGQKVDLSLIALDNQYYALDNGFVYILIHYGILGSLIIAGFQQKAIMKCIEKKDVVLTTIGITYYFGGQGCSLSEFEGDYTMNGHSDHKLFTYNNKGIVEESIEIVPNEIIEFKGNRYCFDSYYKPYNGVREVNGKKYYFVNIDAWTYKGVHTIDGERYYFNENGQLAVNREDKEYISISFVDGYGIDRYLVSYDKDGKVKETKLIKPNQWIEFAGGKYYFNKNYDAYNGWQEIDGKMYFFDENSKVHTGWLEVDGKKYYLNQDGVMVTGTQEIDGKQYTFNEKGEMYDANKSADNKNTTEQIKTETVFKSTNKKDKSSKVKTGDETVVGMWSILMFISGLFGIRGFKRKKEI